jgi:hypothetical protein
MTDFYCESGGGGEELIKIQFSTFAGADFAIFSRFNHDAAARSETVRVVRASELARKAGPPT